ncbi:large conductance mechanosensitive channel protein MscL [Actinopolymorpha alba]|uniref:large conductance mechanosensitive channel protein MscL n=1 Tax=Actinopolymorpha alba TaxID=533267 RepID=UPI000365D888|nr:large conductance mechanosensitive channel protein MscL [Actinopolymorpha alba]
MIQGFKQFLMRGNVVDLAVAVVIGAAFGKIVTAVLDGFINPLIAAIFGKPDLTGVGRFTINNAHFSIGLILDAVLNFVIIAAAVYFLVVVPINKLMELRRRGQVIEDPEPTPPTEDVVLLRDIRDLLARSDRPTSSDRPT